MKKSKETNPFKQLEDSMEVPESLKKAVMTSIEYSHMISDMMELFTVNKARAAASLFRMKDPDKNKNQK